MGVCTPYLTDISNNVLKFQGLTGFLEAVRAVYSDTHVQLCIVHMLRNSTKFVSYKDLKKLCAGLKAVYSALSEEAGRDALKLFGEVWNGKYPMITKRGTGTGRTSASFSTTRLRSARRYTRPMLSNP
jgi:transposase-like protein